MSTYTEYENELNAIVEKIKKDAPVFKKEIYDADVRPGRKYYDDYSESYETEFIFPNETDSKYWDCSMQSVNNILRQANAYELIIEILQTPSLTQEQKLHLLNKTHDFRYFASINFLTYYRSTALLDKLLTVLQHTHKNTSQLFESLLLNSQFNQQFFIEDEGQKARLEIYLKLLKEMPVKTIGAVFISVNNTFLNIIAQINSTSITQELDTLFDILWRANRNINQMLNLYRLRFTAEIAIKQFQTRVIYNTSDNANPYKCIMEILKSNLSTPSEKLCLLNDTYFYPINLGGVQDDFFFCFPNTELLDQIFTILLRVPANEYLLIESFILKSSFNQQFLIADQRQEERLVTYLNFLQKMPAETIRRVLVSVNNTFIYQIEQIDSTNIRQRLDTLFDILWQKDLNINQMLNLYRLRFTAEIATQQLLEKIISGTLNTTHCRILLAASSPISALIINMDDNSKKLETLNAVLMKCHYLSGLSFSVNTLEMERLFQERTATIEHLREASSISASAASVPLDRGVTVYLTEPSAPPILLIDKPVNDSILNQMQSSIRKYRRPTSFLELGHQFFNEKARMQKANFLECLLSLINTYTDLSVETYIQEAKILTGSVANITGEDTKTGNVYSILAQLRSVINTTEQAVTYSSIEQLPAEAVVAYPIKQLK